MIIDVNTYEHMSTVKINDYISPLHNSPHITSIDLFNSFATSHDVWIIGCDVWIIG